MQVSTSKVSNVARRHGAASRGLAWLAAAAMALPLAACAVGGNMANGAANASAAPAPVHSSLKPNPEFAGFPQYVGTLGKRPIVMRLGAKTDDPDDKSGVHGEYQFTDTGEVILIAGDRTGPTLEAEESNDGTHITGNWVGTFAADGALSGDRMEVDDSNPQPFDLKPLAAGASAPAVSAAHAAGAATAATPAEKGGHAVGGVGNLVTGE
ncbi:hypothetical protein ACFSHT_11010 [Paraburkholderia silviterrae]|uniref:Lipoprotein n=1 Tax=Paraburkholderia silviterrae TaxID=2528715 RepID=A0A4R5MEX2_9BURK|nr:hypothetical protein [Paraburkholderia silviterrae]TDG25474.1 hypothetical protein EYW47_06495 [Paraburkholderia silviterrae]